MTASASGQALQRRKHERKSPPLDHPRSAGNYPTGGSLLNDNPRSVRSNNQHTQTWKATYAAFPAEITIPLARCTGIASVTYLDQDDEEQTLAPSAYRVTGLNTDKARIRPVNGTAWPSTYRDAEAVTITFTAGFGDEPEDVPGSIRHAILEAVARAYEYSEPVIDGRSFSSLPGSATSAVTDWRVWPE